ncbi:MAG: outer membrane beta-barrel protein [Bacteroidetes bacterium]|nr:outer membrane beta-barrel protein [Bacteroidota bacterium]
MKSFFITLTLVCALTGTLYAQKGFYLKVDAGYSLAFGKIRATDPMYSIYSSTTLSFGKGLQGGISGGYSFNQYLCVELSVSYFLSSKTVTHQNFPIYPSDTIKIDRSQQSHMLRFLPVFVVTADKHKITPYGKFGPVFGIGNIVTDESSYNGALQTKLKMYGGFPIGIYSCVGILYILSDKLQLYAEINNLNMIYAPTKGKYTKYTINGADQLPVLSTNMKEIEYVDSSPIQSTDSNEPQKILKTYYPFSSVGLNAGVKIGF